MVRRLQSFARASRLLLRNPAMLRTLMANLMRLQYLNRKEKIVCISLVEHMGDIIAATPIIQHVSDLHPGCRIIWFCQPAYRDLLIDHPLIDKVFEVNSLTEWILLRSLLFNIRVYDLHIDGKECERYYWVISNPNPEHINVDNYYHKGNLLYCFSRTAGLDTDPTHAPKVQLKLTRKQTAPYILLHTSSASTQRMWHPEGWNELVAYLERMAPGYRVIEIGTKEQVTRPGGNYSSSCGLIPYDELAALIHDCSLFIGVDSGPAHLANAFNKRSLILMGHFASFKVYMPYSGHLQSHANEMILQYPGKLSEMKFEYFTPHLIKALQTNPD